MATLSITNRAPDATAFASLIGLLGRLLMAAIFLISGVGKIANAEATAGYIASVGLPLPQVALVIAIVIEVVGGAALVVGYRTRLVATVLALFCIATAVSFHAAFGDQNQFIHFFKNLTMAGGFLQIVAFGPGALSVDAKSRRAASIKPAIA
ncbi:putative oxidoreductase [Lysobacter niabensis]|uniref:Oxidoreductase n=1 Tax=Agrilutibacter niabensis TaxID=380628 RepID=A0ABU1VNB2_9GAMM|nr:DoxX family protein [Lysobacter niabensis]MDR7098957.1 putative oxidoreductase [Lysobacter niabensis]